MKHLVRIILLILLCSPGISVFADTIPEKGHAIDSLKTKHYVAKIKFSNGKKPIKGILYKVQDSSLILLDQYDYSNKSTHFDTLIISSSDIDVIKIWRKGRLLKSVGIFTATGAAVGYFSVLFSKEPNTGAGHGALPKESRFFLGTVGGGIIGFGTGLIIGSIKTTIPIGGKQHQFLMRKYQLQRYALKK